MEGNMVEENRPVVAGTVPQARNMFVPGAVEECLTPVDGKPDLPQWRPRAGN